MIPIHACTLHYRRPPSLRRIHLDTAPGRIAQAAFFRWLSQRNPHLADRIHDVPAAPYALVLEGFRHVGRGTFSVAEEVMLRVAVVGTELVQALAGMAEHPLVLRVFDEEMVPTTVLTPGDGGVRTTAEALMDVPHVASYYRVTFLAPAIFHPNGLDDPLPTPLAFFGGLYERWGRVVGLRLAMERGMLETFVHHHVMASRFALRTVPVHFKRRVRAAVVGRVAYEIFREDPAALLTLAVLVRFARIMGAGAYTGMALGAVRIDEGEPMPAPIPWPMGMGAMEGVGGGLEPDTIEIGGE